ncbi:hypothetical protein FOZ60_014057 [Perkinsus olseni]|uniref:Uncharacterized protein n=1 Tax=Perkinsus olseni TaxID=32597 RepID=A0A7J6NB33_PEROL|nr:hypothetical protein FOZ60_014057 [Perkinsus olseni]
MSAPEGQMPERWVNFREASLRTKNHPREGVPLQSRSKGHIRERVSNRWSLRAIIPTVLRRLEGTSFRTVFIQPVREGTGGEDGVQEVSISVVNGMK